MTSPFRFGRTSIPSRTVRVRDAALTLPQRSSRLHATTDATVPLLSGATSSISALLAPGVSLPLTLPLHSSSRKPRPSPARAFPSTRSATSPMHFSSTASPPVMMHQVCFNPLCHSTPPTRSTSLTGPGGQTESGTRARRLPQLHHQDPVTTTASTAPRYGQLRNQRLNAANALSQSTLPMTPGLSVFGKVFPSVAPLLTNHAHGSFWLPSNEISTRTASSRSPQPTPLRSTPRSSQRTTPASSSLSPLPQSDPLFQSFTRYQCLRALHDERIGDKETLHRTSYSFYKIASQNSRNGGGLSATSRCVPPSMTLIKISLPPTSTSSTPAW